ncbi:MAG: hypothetical protein VXX11_00415, partial [Planctomycetota bacterium]|nr:hypothetical protein [Planctomycetota bacterium]
ELVNSGNCSLRRKSEAMLALRESDLSPSLPFRWIPRSTIQSLCTTISRPGKTAIPRSARNGQFKDVHGPSGGTDQSLEIHSVDKRHLQPPVRGSSLNFEKSGAIKGCGHNLSVLVFGVFLERIQRIY